MKIKIYGSLTCPACLQAKKFFLENKIDYEYILVGKDISIEDFKEKFNIQAIPVITIDEKVYYGFSQNTLALKLGLKTEN